MESDTENESDLEYGLIPSEYDLQSVKVNSFNALPEISKKKYAAAYKLFMNWLGERKTYSEDVLLNYFVELSSKFKCSTLWTQYSMLRTTLSIHNDVDISRYVKLRAFLKRKSHGYRPKKAKTFTSSEINRFINEAPDEIYLLTKVALIMGVMGGCRRHELHQIKTTNMNDLGTAVLVTIPDPKTRGGRTFTITGTFYDIFKKYADLRPPRADTSFFLNYQKGKCTIQRVGINKFGSMGKQIATYLRLPNPESYTGHCFRRSSATLLIDPGMSLTSSIRKRQNDWKATVVAEVNIKKESENTSNEENIINRFGDALREGLIKTEIDDTADDISEECINGEFGDTTNIPLTSKTETWNNQDNLTFQISSVNSLKLIFNNCSNITFNIVDDKKK